MPGRGVASDDVDAKRFPLHAHALCPLYLSTRRGVDCVMDWVDGVAFGRYDRCAGYPCT